MQTIKQILYEHFEDWKTTSNKPTVKSATTINSNNLLKGLRNYSELKENLLIQYNDNSLQDGKIVINFITKNVNKVFKTNKHHYDKECLEILAFEILADVNLLECNYTDFGSTLQVLRTNIFNDKFNLYYKDNINILSKWVGKKLDASTSIDNSETLVDMIYSLLVTTESVHDNNCNLIDYYDTIEINEVNIFVNYLDYKTVVLFYENEIVTFTDNLL